MFAIHRTYTYFAPAGEELEGMGERNDMEKRGGNIASPVTIRTEENRTADFSKHKREL